MYTLTALEAVLVGLGLVAAVTLLIVGVCFAAPRTRRLEDVVLWCPLLRRRVTARVARDDWTLRLVDVTRCSALDRYSTVICAKQCLTALPGARLSRAA